MNAFLLGFNRRFSLFMPIFFVLGVGFFAGVVVGQARAGTMTKCVVDGKVSYSMSDCEKPSQQKEIHVYASQSTSQIVAKPAQRADDGKPTSDDIALSKFILSGSINYKLGESVACHGYKTIALGMRGPEFERSQVRSLEIHKRFSLGPVPTAEEQFAGWAKLWRLDGCK